MRNVEYSRSVVYSPDSLGTQGAVSTQEAPQIPDPVLRSLLGQIYNSSEPTITSPRSLPEAVGILGGVLGLTSYHQFRLEHRVRTWVPLGKKGEGRMTRYFVETDEQLLAIAVIGYSVARVLDETNGRYDSQGRPVVISWNAVKEDVKKRLGQHPLRERIQF